MNLKDAVKEVVAAGQDLKKIREDFEADPTKQDYIDAATDAIMHLEKALQDLDLPPI